MARPFSMGNYHLVLNGRLPPLQYRELKSSWAFPQQPKKDFVRGSFRSFPVPGEEGVILVYGRLKRAKNPGKQRWLLARDGSRHERLMAEHDFWLALKRRVARAKSADDLCRIIADVDRRRINSILVRGLIDGDIADRARELRISKMPKTAAADERIVRLLREGRIENPGQPPKKTKSRKKNKGTPPKKSKTKASKKAKKSNKATPRKHIVLRSPRQMPDPGPCSWLGSLVEWAWVMKPGDVSKHVDENGNAIWDPHSEWMFMWSPRYKAIVSMRRPRNMYQLAGVDRHGGAAKMFETFAARPAENTFEVIVPDVPIHKVGDAAAHIVYRSDKWSPKRLKSDYIHKFSKGVKIYCGPTLENPEVFLCFGGRLTLTKRGLVW